jgi:RNA polymerase sigma-70 factor (ECF subfamily)
MRAYAQVLTGDKDAADDLAQDAMLKAWRSRGQFTLGTSIKRWTFTILRNQFLCGKRSSWRAVQLEREVAENTLVATDNPSAPLELEDLRQALEQLPEVQRDALVLSAAAGFSYDEVAAICGCAVGTAKSRVNRARTALQLIIDHGRVGKQAPAHNSADAIASAAAQIHKRRTAALAGAAPWQATLPANGGEPS